ncbi:MAG: hypothetical protein LBS55_10150, partial [Prevotellaceae bacterium]|nr:hypothetical protein [Prevotellaceae bacterium]
MAQDTDNGLAIWDSKSRGTKFNTEAMIKLGKKLNSSNFQKFVSLRNFKYLCGVNKLKFNSYAKNY